MKFAVAALPFVFAVGACASSSANDPADAAHNGTTSNSREITLALGASADVASANLHISFDSVAGDSRCPATVQCVWAGSAIVKLTTSMINGLKSIQPITLETVAGRDSVTTYNQPLKLLRVEPVRVNADPVPLPQYRVVLKVGSDK